MGSDLTVEGRAIMVLFRDDPMCGRQVGDAQDADGRAIIHVAYIPREFGKGWIKIAQANRFLRVNKGGASSEFLCPFVPILCPGAFENFWHSVSKPT